MIAIISELWETGIDILTTENDSDEIQSLADLRKCENVLVGKREKGAPSCMPTEVMIDDQIVYILFRNVSHPTGCGKLRVCEVQ